jgi:hypothetical protein
MGIAVHAMSRTLATLALLTALAGSVSAQFLDFRALNLINGWEHYSSQTYRPSIAMDANNVVHLRGAMFQPSGTDPVAFILPKAYRPQERVFLPVSMINGAPGRLLVQPSGIVGMVAAGDHTDAQNFTSLDGVTYSRR